MHVHTSALDGLIVGAWFLIWAYLIRLVESLLPNTAVGKALAFIH